MCLFCFCSDLFFLRSELTIQLKTGASQIEDIVYKKKELKKEEWEGKKHKGKNTGSKDLIKGRLRERERERECKNCGNRKR